MGGWRCRCSLLGGAILGWGLPTTDAVHALTTGAVGVMTLAVMTRASLGHTGRPRHAGPMTVCIYILVNLGAMLRVFGPSTDLPRTSRPWFGCGELEWRLSVVCPGLWPVPPSPESRRVTRPSVLECLASLDLDLVIGLHACSATIRRSATWRLLKLVTLSIPPAILLDTVSSDLPPVVRPPSLFCHADKLIGVKVRVSGAGVDTLAHYAVVAYCSVGAIPPRSPASRAAYRRISRSAIRSAIFR